MLLSGAVSSKSGDRYVWQGYCSAAFLCFQFLENVLLIYSVKRGLEAECGVFEINIGPTEAKNLALSRTQSDRGFVQGI